MKTFNNYFELSRHINQMPGDDFESLLRKERLFAIAVRDSRVTGKIQID